MKLRVVHIITQLELGGAQRNTLYTVNHLDPERYAPFLLCGRGGLLDQEARQAAWPTHFIHGLVRPLRPWRDAYALYALYIKLRDLKPHIVHTHSSKAGILGRVAAYLAGVPVIIHTFHGFGFNAQQKPLIRWLFVTLERLAAPLSSHLVFVSEANRKEAQGLGIVKKIPTSLIRSGIPLKDTPSQPLRGADKRSSNRLHKSLQDIPEAAWRVVYVGNFKPQKNPMDLAIVAKAVLAERPDIHFLLAGDGELRSTVESWCREQGIKDRVHFLGWCLRRQDVKELLAASHCFLMTSLWEGLPRSLVEAMAAGLPAVVYGVDGALDIVKDGDTGFLIPPRDTALSAEKILWLARHRSEAKAMGKRGAREVTAEFDIDQMVRQQETLYEGLYQRVPLKHVYEPHWGEIPR